MTIQRDKSFAWAACWASAQQALSFTWLSDNMKLFF